MGGVLRGNIPGKPHGRSSSENADLVQVEVRQRNTSGLTPLPTVLLRTGHPIGAKHCPQENRLPFLFHNLDSYVSGNFTTSPCRPRHYWWTPDAFADSKSSSRPSFRRLNAVIVSFPSCGICEEAQQSEPEEQDNGAVVGWWDHRATLINLPFVIWRMTTSVEFNER